MIQHSHCCSDASIQAQMKSLTKAHEVVKHQRHQLQTQVRYCPGALVSDKHMQCQMLMQMRGSKADVEKMRRLEQALSQVSGQALRILLTLQSQAKSELLHTGSRVLALEREKTQRLSKSMTLRPPSCPTGPDTNHASQNNSRSTIMPSLTLEQVQTTLSFWSMVSCCAMRLWLTLLRRASREQN